MCETPTCNTILDSSLERSYLLQLIIVYDTGEEEVAAAEEEEETDPRVPLGASSPNESLRFPPRARPGGGGRARRYHPRRPHPEGRRRTGAYTRPLLSSTEAPFVGYTPPLLSLS